MANTRESCKYGDKCYQKNPQHLKRFKHPVAVNIEDDKNLIENVEEEVDKTSPPKKKLKLEDVGSNDHGNLEDQKASPIKEKEGSNDEGDLPDTPISPEESIKQKFLVDMPKDFYDFWEFCKSYNSQKPEDTLTEFGLKLVGPFEVLSGKLRGSCKRKLSDFLCHWRFYYDPPEFQTILVGEDEYHIGYFRDDPLEDPVFLASLSSNRPGIIQPLKEEIFSTVCGFIESKLCKADESKKKEMVNTIKTFARNENCVLNETMSKRLRQRKKKVVSKSFHEAGIVVPVDKVNDVGYREIPETNADLKRILKKIVEAPTKETKGKFFETLQELMTNAQWATDEGDFGMGLELGIDLFSYGGEVFHSFIMHLLTVAYDLLHREPFAKIIKAHLRNRRKGLDLSMFKAMKNS